MTQNRAPLTFWEKITKQLFFAIWFFAKKISPDAARQLLYWGISDKALVSQPFADPSLHMETLGKTFPNPIGIAAGFDKEVKYNDELIRNGFGFGELGTFTYKPDHHSQKTHFIPDKRAIVVESESFPNNGIVNLGNKLIARRRLPHIVGVNISSSLDIDERNIGQFLEYLEQDLIHSIQHVAPYCDFITLNLSHPGMPISTLIHNPAQLGLLLRQIKQQIKKFAPIITPKLILKIPYDGQINVQLLSDMLIEEQVDGLIVAGFSASKSIKQILPDPRVKGCIAGEPLKDPSTELLRRFYLATRGKITLIACGGVFTGRDAFEKIKAGASLIQLHSAILYEGVEIANKINRELSLILRKNGLKSVQEAVGKTAELLSH